MSGFERILARVGGDALRDYCSSAIEDELRHLKTRMQSCVASLEKALAVQEAVAKLDVPLSRENADVCAGIKRSYEQFSTDLQQFVKEQKQIQAESVKAGIKPPVGKRDVASADANTQATPTQADRVTKLLAKIQNRITKKRSNAWIDKNFADVAAIAKIVSAKDFPEPSKTLRHELVLVLDHLISAVLLSPLTSQSTLQELEGVLGKLYGVHKDIDEYIESSCALLTKKQPSYASQNGNNASSAAAAYASSVNIVDAQVLNSAISSEPQIKRQRVEEPVAAASDFLVKVERTAAANAVANDANTVYEVYVTDLPWGTTKEADVSSYFGIAGAVVSVRMPTMDDGSTVGVAIVRFVSFEGMTLALRMNGYPFNGKNIRVSVHKSS